MRNVGLTGGIASGESSVSGELHNRGIPIVDADKIAHDVLKKGTRAWKRVVEIFGREILLESGEVNRPRLGPTEAQAAEQVSCAIKPFIAFAIFWVTFKHWLYGTRVLVLDIPLLYEAKMDWMAKPVVVVWLDRQTQEARILRRDCLPEEQGVVIIGWLLV
ncbi:hypothetical protein R1sor_026270 [Riccia sorocarpa]|uniref:Dephospho-CoA kinase n=1 Tax=Riccia sorocarpa TaxID=122646 RepID=A0ABD3GAY1_9MARC